MFKKNEFQVLELVFTDLTKNYTIHELSLKLKQKYFQTYRTIKELEKKGLIILKKIGNSSLIFLNFKKNNPSYSLVELGRLSNQKNKEIILITEKLYELKKQFICILFGSYAQNKQKKDSDIDLLFIIPQEYEENIFEQSIKNALILYDVDINIIHKKELFDMWDSKKELNVGKEILKNRIVLYGVDIFINYLGDYYEKYRYV
jgi:predicted nucleotidyltransferase